MPRLNLYKKILLSTSIVVSFLIVATLFILNSGLKAAISKKIGDDLSRAKIVSDTFIKSRFDTLFLNSRIIAESPHLKTVVATPNIDYETVIFAMRELHEIIKSDFFTITDSRGIVLARIDEPSKFGDNISADPHISNALNGEETASIAVKDSLAYQQVSLPIILNNVVEGTLTAGFLIDDKIAGGIREMTGAEVAFISNKRVIAFAGDQSDKAQFEYLIRHYPDILRRPKGSSSAKGPLELSLDSDKHLAIVTSLAAAGTDVFLAIQMSLREAMAFYYRNIQSVLILIGIIAIFIAVYISSALAGSISGPILKLAGAAQDIAKGDFSRRLDIKTNDEIAILNRAFNKMAADLNTYSLSLKKANEELARWSRTLEQQVEEKTRELKEAQAQIVQSAKMAAVGRLAGGVAHEINNPLTGVLNNVQLLKLDLAEKKCCPQDDELKEVLGIVEESALRCKKIVQALLDFSQPAQIKYGPADLNKILEDTLILGEYDIKLSRIEVIREFAPGLPAVMANPAQLKQVFLSIFQNAKWALRQKKEGAQLRIKTWASEDIKWVTAEISDNGCGIEKENLRHIFEPFFTTRGPREATGLSLSICYEIIRQHQGTIEAESQGTDKGATFTIRLPAKGA